MRDLMGYGNFDEFRDHREPDGLNDGLAEIIAKHIRRAVETEREGGAAVKPLATCANGDGRPIQSPLKVLCRECLSALDARLGARETK